jgi:hypothetical protein
MPSLGTFAPPTSPLPSYRLSATFINQSGITGEQGLYNKGWCEWDSVHLKETRSWGTDFSLWMHSNRPNPNKYTWMNPQTINDLPVYLPQTDGQRTSLHRLKSHSARDSCKVSPVAKDSTPNHSFSYLLSRFSSSQMWHTLFFTM